MLVNPDFSRHAVVRTDEHPWVASPQPGVQRLMLDRLGGEHARATSLVRYAPRSTFPPHAHPGGEEILVLSGTFSDESGDHGPGCYLRNPPGSSHRPASAEGALIFVKLWQMSAADTRTVRVDTRQPSAWRRQAASGGAPEVCPLYANAQETVSLLRLHPGQAWVPDTRGGAELLVLGGQLQQADAAFEGLSWLRLPPGAADAYTAGAGGATLYLKTGHLAAVRA
jgi:anti-sigma factor ChrR (cupin superfamily)